MERFRKEEQVHAEHETSEEFESLNKRLRRYAAKQVFGCDFDPSLIRASQMNMVMAGDGKGHLYYLNSLEFPAGHLPGVKSARRTAQLGSADVVMTNPPFGSTIPITDANILRHFDLAHVWERTEERNFRNTGRLQGSVAPEILFIERCLDWLRPGGRMGIVLPDGILGNPAAEYIRWWIPEARLGAGQRGPSGRDLYRGSQRQHPHQPAVLEEEAGRGDDAGGDQRRRRLSDLHGGRGEGRFRSARQHAVPALARGGRRSSEPEEESETVIVNGRRITRTLRRKKRIVDDDLPEIAKRYPRFSAGASGAPGMSSVRNGELIHAIGWPVVVGSDEDPTVRKRRSCRWL